MPLMPMAHAKDPKQEIVDRIGDISDVKLAGNLVLVAIYQRPEKTASGIYLTDGNRGEDKYQGKCGLILKMGPTAFVDDDKFKFHGFNLAVGDWAFFKVSDGWPVGVNARDGDCRVISDADIKFTRATPDFVW